MALNLTPFQILGTDKLRTGFRAKYNLLLNKVIKDWEVISDVNSVSYGMLNLITKDNTKIPLDLSGVYYTKEVIDDLFTIRLATEEEAGIIRIATEDEALQGDDDNSVITPYKLWLVLSYFDGRPAIAGEDMVSGQAVYLYYPEVDPDAPEPNPEDEPLFPVLTAKLAVASSEKTLCMGWCYYDALAGEETVIKFSSTINTYKTGILPGTYYYLSSAYPGELTIHPPGDPGEWQQIVGYGSSEFEVFFEIEQGLLNWEPVFEDFPELYYTVDVLSAQSIDLLKYYADYNVIETEIEDPDTGVITIDKSVNFTYELSGLPDWITEHTIIFENLRLAGNPPKVGRFVAYLKVKPATRPAFMQPIIINVVPAPKIKSVLIETGLMVPAIIGPIPGAYKAPEKGDTKSTLEVRHDKFEIDLTGGGVDGSSISHAFSQEVTETDIGAYRAFLEEDGTVFDIGIYKLEVASFLRTQENSRFIQYFTIFDAAYLAKMVAELWNTGTSVKIGDISIQGTTIFKYQVPFDVKAVFAGLLHDKVTIRLYLDGELIKTTVYTLGVAALTGTYFIYAVPQTGQLAGDYVVEWDVELAAAPVYQRRGVFSMQEKKKVAEAGEIILIAPVPNTLNYDEIQTLPLTGTTMMYPENGYDALIRTLGGPVDYILKEFFVKNGNTFAPFDLTKYTKEPNFVEFPDGPVDSFEIRMFDGLSSSDIGDLNEVPKTVRFKFTGRTDGAAGELTSIAQADVTFRPYVAPADQSSLRFIHIGSDGTEVLDPNMPKIGGTYPIPTIESEKKWSVSFRSLMVDGALVEFDEFMVEYIRDGVVLHNFGPTYIIRNNVPATTELVNDQIAYIFADGVAGSRTLPNPSNVPVPIDVPGHNIVKVTLWIYGVLVGTPTAEFDLVLESDIPEVPESDCGCCEKKEWFFVNLSTWTINHNLGRKEMPEIYMNSRLWNTTVTHSLDMNTTTVTWSVPRTGSVMLPKE